MGRLSRFVLAHVGQLPAAKVTPQDVHRCLHRIGKPETARRTRIVLSQIFEWAAPLYVPKGHNPAHDVRKQFPKVEQAPRPALTDRASFGGLLRAIDAYGGRAHVMTGIALKVSPLVMLRSSELRKGTWAEVDFERGLWTVPAERMKVKRDRQSGKARAPHIVPLARQAVALLRELHRITGPREGQTPSDARMFPGLRGSARFMSEGTLTAALATMGYKGAHCHHGFRASPSTILNDMAADEGGVRFDREHIERQLAHRDDDAKAADDDAVKGGPRHLGITPWSPSCGRRLRMSRLVCGLASRSDLPRWFVPPRTDGGGPEIERSAAPPTELLHSPCEALRGRRTFPSHREQREQCSGRSRRTSPGRS